MFCQEGQFAFTALQKLGSKHSLLQDFLKDILSLTTTTTKKAQLHVSLIRVHDSSILLRTKMREKKVSKCCQLGFEIILKYFSVKR